jgi:division/cell wall cluster transcriptional repressor MraZ
MVYSEQGWDDFMQAVEEKYEGRELVLFKRFANANIDSVEPDKQGRVTLKAEFCQFANLSREVFVVGAENHFEIWDIKEWADMEEKEGAFFKGFNGPY